MRITGEGQILSNPPIKNNQLDYRLSVTFFIKEGEHFYHEEEERVHQATINNGKVVRDFPLTVEQEGEEQLPAVNIYTRSKEEVMRFSYDRRAAVQYAERWWNDYNPAYKKFSVDCTNYVSQCLHAGGAPMWGYPKRERGWWHQGSSWSYSWSVAHSLRWYLSGARQGLKGKEVEKADDLYPGDVICYDFEGDNRWNHTAIVVARDNKGMPLVNAHTDNSRHRYWSYEDSAAWTEDCRYKFFRIGE